MNTGLWEMQAEFESSRLDVILVPCRRRVNEGGCIRVCAGQNAKWYRRFCARHLTGRFRANRHEDTKLKRREVARLLARLVAGLPCRSKYAAELLAIAAGYNKRAAA